MNSGGSEDVVINQSTEAPGNIILCTGIFGVGENNGGSVVLDQFTQVKKRGLIADSSGLLHVMGDDNDGVFIFQGIDQVLDLSRGNRIQG